MLELLAIMTLLPGVSTFAIPGQTRTSQRYVTQTAAVHSDLPELATFESKIEGHTWSPHDLTKDNPGFPEIPDDDYIKIYQENPELWPVEFFVIAYRRYLSDETGQTETQVLVRRSANGTSKYGVGTGVPATRWVVSAEQPPRGYEWSDPVINFEASKFPEFDSNQRQSWTYQKIDIREDAFHDSHSNTDLPSEILEDPDLEKYARNIRNHLRTELSATMQKNRSKKEMSSWEVKRNEIIQKVLDRPNSVAAIQGTLRMSGLFEKRKSNFAGDDDVVSPDSARCVDLGGETGPDPVSLAKSVQIYTMFPQMPDPMPLPSTPPEELKKEIAGRYSRMVDSGRDPHKDKYGRTFTHISTSNVSNTIHGVYFSLDLTDYLPQQNHEFGKNDNEITPPALDLFGTKTIKREWKTLEDLKVLDSEGKSISTEDPKPTFISGFIVRQLVKDGIIDIHNR
jgi:hypothetical protein